MSLDDRPDSRPDHRTDSDTLADAPPITDPAPVVAAVDPTPTRRSRLRLPLLLAAPVPWTVVAAELWGRRDPVLPWPIDGRRARRALADAEFVK